MKLGIEKLIEEHKLDLENLPADIQKLITDIKKSKSSIEYRISIGQNINPKTIESLKERDQELIEKLYDHLDISSDDDSQEEDEEDDDSTEGGEGEESEEDDNEGEGEEDEEDENEGDENEEGNMVDLTKYDANKIDSELSSLIDQGITEINFMDIRSACPHAYELLFEAYEANKENGVRTTFYEMIETQPNSETFKITKL